MLDKMFNHAEAGHFQFLGGILANLSSCVVLDRFQAVETVGALETTARELMQQNSFLASKYLAEICAHQSTSSKRWSFCLLSLSTPQVDSGRSIF